MRHLALLAGAGLLIAAITVAWRVVMVPRPALNSESIPITTILRDAPADPAFAQATAVRPFEFPADHGPHRAFRSEWWYFTGNLRADGGEEFGYQLTLFRYALAPAAPASVSAWRGNEVYLGHFAISDIGASQHASFERFSRPALGLAGSRTDPVAIWLEDWRIERLPDDGWRLRARTDNFALALDAHPEKPPVLQGDRGLSRKSSESGNASYYYSVTRLTTQGTLATPRGRFPVTGLSWLDREWSTSTLGPRQTGWDWFGLQLDSGEELMFYQIRADGSSDPLTTGILIDRSGAGEPLDASAVALRVTGFWTSPTSGARYPAAWTMVIPKAGIDLRIEPRFPAQELNHALRYWEGAVAVTGRRHDTPVRGTGYVELTGY